MTTTVSACSGVGNRHPDSGELYCKYCGINTPTHSPTETVSDYKLDRVQRITERELNKLNSPTEPTVEKWENKYSTDDLKPAGKLHGRCKYCDRGMEQMMIDQDGVDVMVSGEVGYLGHALDDYSWPCPNPPIGAARHIPLKYFDTGLIYRMKMEQAHSVQEAKAEEMYKERNLWIVAIQSALFYGTNLKTLRNHLKGMLPDAPSKNKISDPQKNLPVESVSHIKAVNGERL